jgi:hypothetical protein
MFAIRSSPRFPPLRSFASLSPSQITTATQSPFQVFDRHAKRLQKDRAAARDGGNRSRAVDYVRDEVANRMIERFMASNYSEKLLWGWLRPDPGYKENVLVCLGPWVWTRSFLKTARVGSDAESDNAGPQ